MDRSPGEFPEITLPTVDEFVETISLLFCVGRSQSEMLSIARSYSAKQDRYKKLVSGHSSLFRAMSGNSIYETEDDEYLIKLFDRYFANMQQLVSWLRSSFVYRSNSQGELYEELSVMIAAPQLAQLLLEIEQHLETYSPLKHVPLCLQALKIYGNEPNRACKILLRCLLNYSIRNKKSPELSFRKSLNSLDQSSSKFTATQTAELKTLDSELTQTLDYSARRRLIDSVTGVYSAMMILNRLKKVMDEWSPRAFESFTIALSDRMFGYNFSEGAINEISALNEYLLFELYKAEDIRYGIHHGPLTSPAYQGLLASTSAYSPPENTYHLDRFLKKGATGYLGNVELIEIHEELKDFRNEPYFEGVNAFLKGLLALHNGDRNLADLHFARCLSEAEKWPLGILEHHAALFRIGLNMSKDPGGSSTRINPLLSTYLKSMPQLHTIQPYDFSRDIENFNLCTAISIYNEYCTKIVKSHSALLFNPLIKIEKYLKKIFDWLDKNKLDTSVQSLGKATRAVTTKRDVQRVRPYLIKQNLLGWLTSDSPCDLLVYFPSTESLLTIPSTCRLLELGDSHRFAIAQALRI